MELNFDSEKPLNSSPIHFPKPTRLCSSTFSPFTQSLMSLSPIQNSRITPSPYFQPFPITTFSPEVISNQLTILTPFEVETPNFSRRVIQKIDFSLYLNTTGKIKANTLPVEIKVYQDDAFEHSSLLTSLSKSKPTKRARNVESSKIGCTCPKSKCLKLYCECFARQEYCEGCNCNDCHNIQEFEEARQEAISVTKGRNPNAFVSKTRSQNDSVQSKGCHCSKSWCLKNYCECYQSGVACSDICQCVGCKNVEVKKRKKRA